MSALTGRHIFLSSALIFKSHNIIPFCSPVTLHIYRVACETMTRGVSISPGLESVPGRDGQTDYRQTDRITTAIARLAIPLRAVVRKNGAC